MCGFRTIGSILNLLQVIPEYKNLLGEELYLKVKEACKNGNEPNDENGGKELIKQIFQRIITVSSEEINEQLNGLKERYGKVNNKKKKERKKKQVKKIILKQFISYYRRKRTLKKKN